MLLPDTDGVHASTSENKRYFAALVAFMIAFRASVALVQRECAPPDRA
jgi:hypothetical protein